MNRKNWTRNFFSSEKQARTEGKNESQKLDASFSSSEEQARTEGKMNRKNLARNFHIWVRDAVCMFSSVKAV